MVVWTRAAVGAVEVEEAASRQYRAIYGRFAADLQAVLPAGLADAFCKSNEAPRSANRRGVE